MLAYAPERRMVGAGQGSRKTLTYVIVGHLALVAVALTTKMTIELADPQGPTEVTNVKSDPPPPEPKPVAEKPTQPAQPSHIDRTVPVIPVDVPLNPFIVDPGPSIVAVGPIIGPPVVPQPPVTVDPPHDPVRSGPVLRTSEGDLRPPYPADKLRAEEEATLKLRLTIDERGRVVAVDPVGSVDRSFLEAARRHLIRSWRYKPATVDGKPIGTSLVINLSFRLEDA